MERRIRRSESECQSTQDVCGGDVGSLAAGSAVRAVQSFCNSREICVRILGRKSSMFHTWAGPDVTARGEEHVVV